MAQKPIYAGAKGVELKVNISGVDTLNGAVNCKYYVIGPGETDEAEWVATPITDTNTLVHKTAQDEPLLEGTYKIHPYFELGDFKGRWSPVSFIVWPHWKKPQ